MSDDWLGAPAEHQLPFHGLTNALRILLAGIIKSFSR